MARRVKNRPQAIGWRNVASDFAKAGIARRHAEPPDTPEQRAEKDALVAAFLRKRKPTKCPPGYASMIGFPNTDFHTGRGA